MRRYFCKRQVFYSEPPQIRNRQDESIQGGMKGMTQGGQHAIKGTKDRRKDKWKNV